MTGTWCCIAIGTSATLSVYSSVGDVDRVVCSSVSANSCLLLPLLFLTSCRAALSPAAGPLFSPGSSYAESAKVLVGAAAVLFVNHALRDAVMAFHELLSCELFAHVVLRTLLYVLHMVC